ncbi:MAG TPA: response regulator [Blastocatellia bacterium]|nr:response regulator [Blastocatellia bacterium]
MSESPVRILLVEDSLTDGQLIVRHFKKTELENQFVWMKDGAAALEFIFAADDRGGLKNLSHLKLVLLDLKLPKVNGLEVLRLIKSDLRTRCLPVVMFSSSKLEEDLRAAYALNVNSYLVKQVGFDEFSLTVADLSRYWIGLNHTPKTLSQDA